jgi:hypothetical protein
MFDKIPGIPIAVQPARGRQVEINNAFELAFTGLSDDFDKENLHEMLTDWLIESFEEDGATSLAGTRSDDAEPEMFIFHMTSWKATCEVLSESTRDRFKTEFCTYPTMLPPQLLHQLNSSGLGRKPGSLRKDLVQGASQVTEGIDKLRQEFNAYKETNTQLHQATQLQLSVTTSTLTSLTGTVSDMENRLVNTQRAILLQSQELSLTRAMTELRSSTISLKVNLMLENDDEKKRDMSEMLGSLGEEEKRLKNELSKTAVDFLSVVQGAPVGHLLPDSSPMPSATMVDVDDGGHIASPKRRRLNTAASTSQTAEALPIAHAGTMMVDLTQPGVNAVVSAKPLLTLNPLKAVNIGIPDPLMMRFVRPQPHRRTSVFHGVFDSLRNLMVSDASRAPPCRSQSITSTSCLPLLILLFLLCLTHLAQASSPSPTSTLSIYALNANGLVQPVKLSHINTVVRA